MVIQPNGFTLDARGAVPLHLTRDELGLERPRRCVCLMGIDAAWQPFFVKISVQPFVRPWS